MTYAVSVIDPVGGHGGADYYDFALCRALTAHGIHPTFFTCDETAVSGNEGFPIALTYQAIYGSDPAWRRGFRFVAGSLRALIGSRLRGSVLAHFHFYQVGPLELFNVLLARLLFMRVVITAHDVEAFKDGLSVKRFVGWAYGMAHAVIAHNQVSRAELLERVGIPDSKIHVIRHGNHIDYIAPNLDPAQARQVAGVGQNDFVILFFGHIREVKGLDVLLKAIPEVNAGTQRTVRVLVAGKMWKSDFSGYQALIDQLGIASNCVLHLRHIEDNELPLFYAAADIVALPYKKIYQSGVVLMAMSFGKPVLVSNLPGMLEVVTHLDTGFVFENENPSSMASQLIMAANDAALLHAIAQRGNQHVLKEYSWEATGRQTAACYSQVLSGQ